MTFRVAALGATDSAVALALLDQAFAHDPCLAWVLQDNQPGYPARGGPIWLLIGRITKLTPCPC